MPYRESFETVMKNIIFAIKAAGYDPKMQLYGYMVTEDARYITRNRGARQRIEQLDKAELKRFLQEWL